MLGGNFDGSIGDIPWPQEPALQKIAQRAGRLCFYRFPFFPLRFGPRGEAFAIRDAGYLITLRGLSAEKARTQIRWLAGVLANRGMPSWLLEIQLQYVERLLIRAHLPAGVLPACRAMLAELRRQHADDEAMNQAGRRFAERLGAPPTRKIADNGKLITAARADEANGLASAAGFLAWMTDAERFSAPWIGAVKDAEAASGAGLP